ncbi:MAG TPA: hypothetical protein VJQ78_09540, partial [Sphingobium sp.]|nr:hypothetical protein [Sphingobium sp.]
LIFQLFFVGSPICGMRFAAAANMAPIKAALLPWSAAGSFATRGPVAADALKRAFAPPRFHAKGAAERH